MAKNVLFYASVDGDRKFGAEDFKMWLGPFFKTGVFNGGLRIKGNGSMILTVEPGHANYQFGPVVEYSEPEAMTVPPAGALPRIDRIVMRRDDPARDVYYHYLQGAGSSNPVPPEITRANGVYDLVLAQFPVNPGTVGITDEIISDMRPSQELCGYVVATVEEIDFSGMWEQWIAMAAQMEEALNGVIDGSQYLLKVGYDEDGRVFDAGGIAPYVAEEVEVGLDKITDGMVISSEETVVFGKKRFGKQVYRREYQITLGVSDSYYGAELSGVDHAWITGDSYANFYTSGGTISPSGSINVNYYSSSGDWMDTRLRPQTGTNSKIQVRYALTGWLGKPMYVVLEYTKTNDPSDL